MCIYIFFHFILSILNLCISSIIKNKGWLETQAKTRTKGLNIIKQWKPLEMPKINKDRKNKEAQEEGLVCPLGAMDTGLNGSSVWWDEEADYWVPQKGESSSMVPISLPVSSSSDASRSSQFPGVRSSWVGPVTEDSSNRTASSASKSHSLAEKRRRDRINAQLASLRKLIPKSDKVSKVCLPL